MKLWKKMISLALAAMLLCAMLPLSVGATGDEFTEVLAQAKKGVVQIYGLGDDGRYLTSWVGTGFAVGDEGKDSDVFLTNWHVVTGNGEYDLEDVQIWILQENCPIDQYTGEPDPNYSITCEVLKTTTGYPDYAIIQATEEVSGYKALPLLSSEDVEDGTTVYALGFPAIVGNASVSHYGIDDITSTNGIISQHMQYAWAGDTWVLMHTAKISGGNSGGPLITENGAVVGLNTYGFGEHEENMDRYCAVYIDYAIEGLDELGIDYDMYSGSKLSNDDMIILIVAGVALAVVLGVIILLVQQNKKKKEEELRRQEEARRRREAELRRQEEERRRQEEERQAAIRQEEERRRMEAASVKARIMLNDGTIYPIRAEGAIIGREKDCTIVLPEKAPGVSRHHCKLRFRGDQLVLSDMDSSYGTYIHGKRLPPSTPIALKPGSKFCLGSEKITFTVC